MGKRRHVTLVESSDVLRQIVVHFLCPAPLEVVRLQKARRPYKLHRMLAGIYTEGKLLTLVARSEMIRIRTM